MFKRILIANRGEIALRIIRTCKEMGIETVAVYSEIDEDSIHVHMADKAICIGPASAGKSYLNIHNIISAALVTECEAVHPGYGFLAENLRLVDACTRNGLKFIGPQKTHMEKMGNKSEARRIMGEAGIPVIPGSAGPTDEISEALSIAEEIGFPVIIKASNGGGGRGIRTAYDEKELTDKFNIARLEADTAFNDNSVYIEKFLERPRHVEFQILADNHGNIIHLGERDCSVQRRNQKILEEAPCAAIGRDLRTEIGEVALKTARAIDYTNAGTVEFLLDGYNNFYFIEMNTRIQVEHTVTEMVTGIDLIKEQIKIAYGERLNISQDEIEINGHSIECRINAEDPGNGFRPCPGEIDGYFVPGGCGIRVDSHIYSGYTIPPTYDSMIGKLAVWGKDRDEAVNRMKRALDEMFITGVNTNIEFQKQILGSRGFLENKIDTLFVERELLGGDA